MIFCDWLFLLSPFLIVTTFFRLIKAKSRLKFKWNGKEALVFTFLFIRKKKTL